MRDRLTWMALWGFVTYVVVTFGLRSWIQWRRTGSTGFRGVSGRPGSLEWLGGVLLVVAFAAAPMAVVLDLMDSLPLVDPCAVTAVRVVGLVLFAIGFVITFLAQIAMGASWRIGVKSDEVTALVTAGAFSVVRNPTFSAMLLAALGLALAVPNAFGLAAWVLAVVAIELQVRFVEEPYLLRTHGEAYRSYTARVGRFVPGLGTR